MTPKEKAKQLFDKILEFINNEDNHTEGELGNSCIDIKLLIHFLNN